MKGDTLQYWVDVLDVRPSKYDWDSEDEFKAASKTERKRRALTRRLGQTEPVLNPEHWINYLMWGVTCNKEGEYPDVAGCVPCYLRDTKGGKYKKTIGWRTDKYCFSIQDKRMMHKIEREEDNLYKTCTKEDTGRCKYCKKASDDGPVHKAWMNGMRVWKQGAQRATHIVALNEKCRGYCLWCSEKVRIEGYECAECGTEFDDIDGEGVPARCSECDTRAVPVEILSCRGQCDETVRGSLSDLDVEITRAGSTKDDTSYNFQLMLPFTPLDDIDHKFAPVGWDTQLAPPSTAEQAAKLGLKSDPFGGSAVGHDDYDDDDEDDDEDEKPKRRRRGGSSKKSRKRRSRDDDYDDDYEDDDDDDDYYD